MNLAKTFLRPVAWLGAKHAAVQVRRFLGLHSDTAQHQERLLMELVRAHEQTAFGREHGFARIRSYGDFAAAVPAGNYETLRPYVDRVLAGETTALLPPGERVLMFSQTSGTTGAPKSIPVTRRFLSDIRRGWNTFGLMALSAHKDAWLRNIVQISSSMRETTSPTGLPCGAISGLLAITQKRIVRRMYCVPQGVSAVADAPSRFYTILRCSVGKDVAFITTANPSSTIKLIETGQEHAERLIRDIRDGTYTPPGEVDAGLLNRLRFGKAPQLAKRIEEGIRRDGQLLPRHFWQLSFLANWTGGTLKLYLKRLRELFGPVPIRDIGLLASEGRFTVPIADETASGIADISSNFLEFIAVDDAAGNARTYLAHELEVGREYFLVLSNWAGLWRYNLDDRVRVTGFYGQTPMLEFLSRGLHTANITGEKITEHQVVEAMRHACAATGLHVERFVLQGRFASTPYYELRLEPPHETKGGMAAAVCRHAGNGSSEDSSPEPAARLAGAMDNALAEINIEYASKRKSTRLDCIKAVLLPHGALAAAEAQKIAQRRGRHEQYKHQYLLTDILQA